MNKDKAQKMLLDGAVLTHQMFLFDEYIYQDGENVFDENRIEMPDFWKYRTAPAFDFGWTIMGGVRSERIRCPECSKEQVGIVKLTKPFHTKIHRCGYCNYCITESEWNNLEPHGEGETIQNKF